MYLNELVLNGFKSFYTRTRLGFEPGITAIVGPNGCGKSNILDAVRWVLGEQSPSQLRGEEIADVISDGNARRNPKRTARAELNFAGVREALDLDRDDLTVAREVGRDGKGKYFLNGDKARLKDIQGIFRDTGVGQDLYSLIGQGDIRDLVVSNPEERREIVEEAAGIASYRHRRDRSKRRLETTREDFEIIDQQLQEKQGRLNQLKGQATKARKFRRVQEEYRKLEFEAQRRTFLDLTEERREKKRQVQKRKQQSEQARKELDQAERQWGQLQNQNRRLQQGMSLQARYKDGVDRKRDEEGRRLVRQETTLESTDEQLRRERRSLADEREGLEQDLSEYATIGVEHHRVHLTERVAGSEVNCLSRAEEELREQLNNVNQKLEATRERDLLDREGIRRAKHRYERLEKERDEEATRAKEAKGKLHERQTAVAETRMELKNVHKRLLDVAQRREGMRRQHRVQQRRAEMLGILAPRMSQREERLRQKLGNVRDKLETLQRLHGEYRGFYEGVQSVMKEADRGGFDGVVGVVANLIEVPSRFEKALQVALGGRLQNIVVEHQDQVGRLIDFLKQNDAGRATFLPLDSLRAGEVPSRARSLTETGGVVGFAGDLVDYPAKVEEAVRYLLGRIVIVEELQVGLKLQKEGRLSGWGGKVVSLDGEQVHSGGPVTGGTVNPRNTQLLARSGKLEELAGEIESLKRELKNHESTRERVEEDYQDADARLERMSSALRGMEDETRRLQQARVENQRELVMEGQDYRVAHRELVDALRKKRSLRFKTLSYRELTRMVEKQEQRRREQTRDVRRKRDQLDRRRQAVVEARRKAERREDRTRSRRDELSGRSRRVFERCRRRESRRQEQLEQIQSVRRKRNNLRVEVGRSKFTLRRLDRILGAWQELEADLRSRQEQFQGELEEANRKLQKAERNAEKQRNRLETARNQVDSIQSRLEEHTRNLEEEFDMEVSEEALRSQEPDASVPEDTSELRSLLREKRSTMKGMRPVNMLADQQAVELEEEVDELRKQREDLETACNQLERLINRLNRRARQQFKEAFEEIQDHFEQYVQDLFQGGEGRLRLTDDPVLEAGIHLEVQPPGETLQQMSALSGGEKSMAALAFLFALFERKTTPFCFLDEVDAALDDQNLAQFVRLLHRFEEETQFIIITHKKITMQAAAQLYGVTMAESGVSEVVGIDMDEAEQFQTAAGA